MRVTVLLFAAARDEAGADTIEVDLPPASTVAALRDALARQCPALADRLPGCRVAVDLEMANDETTVPEAAEVALIPPVSGG